jgi:hypothetical protein
MGMTNLQHFQLGVKNLEMLINIHKIDQMMLVIGAHET